MTFRPLRSLVGITSAGALVCAGLVATATVAEAAPAPGSNPCAPAYDTTHLVPGQTVTGLTTTQGTTPEQFHGVYVGTIDDGIAPGLDLPVFTFEGSRVTRTTNGGDVEVDAGIWAGMSGSPVYDDATGDLVGAVSYGFSTSPSDIGGVTPATYMYDLQNPKYSAAATASATVSLSATERRTLARASAASLPAGGLHVLAPTRQVSGATAARVNANAARSPILQRLAPFKSSHFVAGGSSTKAPADYPIEVGGNLATTFSYGEVTTASVGTVTAMCDGKVIGFGHPDEFTGPSVETFHGASAVTIQEDAAGSYKIANVGTPKGVVNQDRLAGVLGTLAQVPSTATVHSVTTGLGESRDATSHVSVQAALSTVVATQVASNAVRVLDQGAGGDAVVAWTIHYLRNGVPRTLQHSQHYSEVSGLADTISFDAASDVETLVSNPFEKVTVTDVEISSALQPTYRAYRLASIQYLKHGAYHSAPSKGIRTKPGATLKLRALLTAADAASDARPTWVYLPVRTTTSSRGTGSIKLSGQSVVAAADDEDFGEDGDVSEAPAPRNLDDLLALTEVPRQDDVLRRLHYRNAHGKVDKYAVVRAPGVVVGSKLIKLRFPKKPAKH